MQPKVNIGIVDDQELFAEGLAELLGTIPFIDRVKVYDRPDNHFSINESDQDILLLDINMPIKSGYEICEEIRARNKKLKIVFLSVREDQGTVEKVKSLGANGYIFKNSKRDALQKAIHDVAEGRNHFMEKELKFKDKYTFSDGKTVKITYREMEFLKYLVQQMNSKEIAEKMHISEYTVVSYRKSLFQKFQVKNMLGLARYAYEIL